MQALLLLFSFEHRRENLDRVRCIYFSSSSAACLLTLSDCKQKCSLQLNAEFSDNHAGFPLLPKSCLKVLCLKNVGNEFLWQLGCCALDARAGNEAARGLCSLW